MSRSNDKLKELVAEFANEIIECMGHDGKDPRHPSSIAKRHARKFRAWHREEVGRLLDKYDCQVAHCHDGHFPVQSSEDGDVDWVGCDNCTSGRARLEPYATIEKLRASLEADDA